MSEMKAVPLSPALGAVVRGVDVAAGVSETEMAFVRDTLHRHGVIVLRGQKLSPAQQVAFCNRLGALRVSFLADLAVEGVKELTIVSNIVKDGKPIGLVDAGALWHTDGSYLERPDMYTVLYAVQIPQRDGKPLGDTLFLSTAAAYEALPEATRQRIDDARVVHSLAHHIEKKVEANFKAPPVAKNAKPDVVHPMVRTHPVTGRKCIYATEGHTKEVVGLAGSESRLLLEEVFAHVKRPEFLYRHKWQVGDLLIWDNCSTQHLAITDYGDLPRRLHRAGIEGPVPV
jgi:taurine dioxygenase